MTPTATAAKTDARPTAILDAALALFVEEGFAATTVERIRERSGASVGSIYHHFGGKEEIAAELYVEGLRGYQESLLRTLDAPGAGAEATVRALVGHHLRWIERNRLLATFLLSRRETELGAATVERMATLNRDFMPRAFAWFEREVEAGALRALPRALLEPILLGPSQELARHLLAGRVRISWRRAETELAEAAWQALRRTP
jgi:AcrR family transcriptional regulator